MEDSVTRTRSLLAATLVVFLLAVAVRVPSCFQSFWVDELHSAWTIEGTLADVLLRAKLGNQSPVYFLGLWCWRQVFGESEIALRLTSVLATAAAAALLVIGVSQWTQSTIAGLSAGLVMSLESNAIFFGTELRPYAGVILAATIAVFCLLHALSDLRADDGRWFWSGAVLMVLFAALLQPTSLAVLGWLLAALVIVRVGRSRRRGSWRRHDLMLAGFALLVGAVLWFTTLESTWHVRANWGSFAQAPSWNRASGLWSWLWLWMIPLAIALLPGRSWLESRFSHRQRRTILVLAFSCLLASMVLWWVSRLGWVHLWHRRYQVAMLPMFAALVGISVSRFQGSRLVSRVAAAVIATILLAGLTLSQGVLPTAITHPGRLAYRGEDWRGALQWMVREATKGDLLFVDSGLIESRTFIHQLDRPERLDYLRLPVLGPYAIFAGDDRFAFLDAEYELLESHLKTAFANGHVSRVPASTADGDRRVMILTRRPVSRVDLSSLESVGGGDKGFEVQFHEARLESFGGVSVLMLPLVPTPSG